ncbi:DUF4123 domain-containing protein [Paraburkholderia bryophila]|uniref:DUF4123 domain-containing protein n=1 Tax=Paraburkholderia bryophila TaxID=420952 RepID=UPI0038BD067A
MNIPLSFIQADPEQRTLATRGFLLVEPTTLVYAPELATLGMRACTPRVLAHREELMPRLINLSELDPVDHQIAADHWHAEINVERPPVVCAWIDSTADTDELAAHIAHYLIGPNEDGNAVFWRYYDPRVFVLTLKILGTDQRQALLGPITSWQFAWAGHRWRVAGPNAEYAATEVITGWPRPEQWPRINRSEVADQIRRRLPSLTIQQAAQLPAVLDELLLAAAPDDGPANVDVVVDDVWQHLSRDIAG